VGAACIGVASATALTRTSGPCRASGKIPRALLTPFTDNVDLTDGDRSTYAAKAEAERTKVFEKVEVTFGLPPHRAETESSDPSAPKAHRTKPETCSNEMGD
jgi:hypothetical protein